jgi:hypothetical protein
MRVAPVLVTVVAPRTAKLCAEPSNGAVAASAGTTVTKLKLNTNTRANVLRDNNQGSLRILQIFLFTFFSFLVFNLGNAFLSLSALIT